MSTDASRLLGLVFGILVLLGFLSACGSGPPNAIDVSAYPMDMQQRYTLFAHKCSRCHSLERPVQAHIGKGGWRDYVRRMSRHPGAGISEADQRQIAAFLEFHARREAERLK